MRSPDEEHTGPVIRDRRRVDPVTGKVRDPDQTGAGQARPDRPPAAGPGAGPADPAVPSGPARPSGRSGPAEGSPAGPGEDMAVRLAERTADLQRLQAEYANYRKRVERDRMAVREQALANVLSQLLPVLDDIGRAREHGELVGGFKQVAELLEGITGKLGLTCYGDTGDPFDPTLHEALMHAYSDEVSEPTCVRILQSGYKIGERILRPARVAVAEPGEAQTEPGEVAGPAGPGTAAGPSEAQAGPAAEGAATTEHTRSEHTRSEHTRSEHTRSEHTRSEQIGREEAR